jgi:hypothetical protein
MWTAVLLLLLLVQFLFGGEAPRCNPCILTVLHRLLVATVAVYLPKADRVVNRSLGTMKLEQLPAPEQ